MTDTATDLYELSFTGSADVERGPLGRFVDLAAQIEAAGLDVPPTLAAVLAELTHEGEQQ